MPEAVFCFLQGDSFSDVIRRAVALGGDTDTLAAMAGGMAEAFYGVPDDLKARALSYLDDGLLKIVQDWQAFRSAYFLS